MTSGHGDALDSIERFPQPARQEADERHGELRVRAEGRDERFAPDHQRLHVLQSLGSGRAGAAVQERHEAEHIARAEEVDRDGVPVGQHAIDLHAPTLERDQGTGGVALTPEERAGRVALLLRDGEEEVARLAGDIVDGSRERRDGEDLLGQQP